MSAHLFPRPSPGVLRAQLYPVATVLRNGFRGSTLNSRPPLVVVLGRSIFGAWTRGFCCSALEAAARRGHICVTLTHVPAALFSLGASDFCAGYRDNRLASWIASARCGHSCVTLLSDACALASSGGPVFCAWNRGNQPLNTFADFQGRRRRSLGLIFAPACASPELWENYQFF